MFVVYTDSENASPNISPAEVLRLYRRQTGISDAKLVCAMACNEFSVADSGVPNMLDMVGFDSNGPQTMICFVVGGIRALDPPTTTPVASETPTASYTAIESQTAGTQTAGTQTAGTQTAGTQIAGTQTGGTQTAGTQTAGT